MRSISRPIDLARVQVTDSFWQRTMELVRTEVLPYQWEILNDRVEGATPSWCMHNFRAAARLNRRKAEEGRAYVAPTYTFRGFEALPEDPAHPDPDRFYGFVFQDTDFSKWIEAVGYSLTNHPDPALEEIADGAIDLVCAAQLDNGYLDTYYIINGMDAAFTNLRDHHELYCLGHLVEGAVAYWQGTGKDKLLKAACRYADYCAERFGPAEGQCKGYPGHEIAEMALLRLYEVTGVARYRDLACFFLDQRGQEPNYFIQEEKQRNAREGKTLCHTSTNPDYHQAGAPVREQREAVGHAVRAVYLYAGMADAARINGDEALLNACRNLWESIVRRKLYVTGGIGGTHMGEAFSYDFDLPADSAYSETCAAIGLMFFARRMLQLTPDARYADVMEQALYNTVLAGMALDGKSFFYVNPLSVHPEACRRDARLSHVKPVRQKWFGCACCPPNIARLVSSMPQYAYTESDDTLFTHLYVGGTVEKDFGGRRLCMEVDARMPWDGHVTATIRTDGPVEGTIAFRMPGWSNHPTLCVHDKERTLRDGYLYVSGVWRNGETVTLHLPMPVRMVQADPRVREAMDKVAFLRGPMTFCAEEHDNGADLHLLRVDADRIGPGCDGVLVEEQRCFGHDTLALRVPGRRILPPETDELYREAVPLPEKSASILLIPYYCWANRGLNEMTVWLRR